MLIMKQTIMSFNDSMNGHSINNHINQNKCFMQSKANVGSYSRTCELSSTSVQNKCLIT